jgi:hypothetical protein
MTINCYENLQRYLHVSPLEPILEDLEDLKLW